MKEQDKQLLLKVLCAMLPHEVKLLYNSDSIANIKDRVEILRGITIGYTIWFETNYSHSEYDSTSGSYNHFKPYLRPMSSMTKDEKREFQNILSNNKHGVWLKHSDVYYEEWEICVDSYYPYIHLEGFINDLIGSTLTSLTIVG